MGDPIIGYLVNELKAGFNGKLYTVVSGDFAGEKACFGRKSVYSNPKRQSFFEQINIQNQNKKQQLFSDEIDVFCEDIKVAPRLCICGGGHISLELAHIAYRLGFAITVIDEDPVFSSVKRFPMAKNVYNCSFKDALNQFGDGENDYFVIVTRGHQQDGFCLETILQKRFAYVGMIGSRTKTKVLFDNMIRHGFTKEQIDKVYTPIGLDIGAKTPVEIAVAIAAEIIQVKASFGINSVWEPDLISAITNLNRPAALAVIISRDGSTPREAGARMLVYEDGGIVGTIGGGGAEAEAIVRAKEIIKGENRCGIYHCNMNNKDAASLGLVCGGKIDVFIEKIS